MQKKLLKIVYLALSIFLGFLLSIVFHSLLEIFIINQSSFPEASGLLGNTCYLPDFINLIIAFIGLIAGLFLGIYWHKKIYE